MNTDHANGETWHPHKSLIGQLIDRERDLDAAAGRLRPMTEFAAGAILEAVPAAVCTTDRAGRITYYNEAAAKLWGRRQLVGESLFSGSLRLSWPDGSRWLTMTISGP